ncbi:hypothetical protein C8J57DRAFT_1434614 [Mycena rebaudengoi]|nr:hypothetical protein C8J57DRAFT_1434614 [Mycena rebaudengoi]
MSHTRNARVIFNSIPAGYPVPGETTVYDDTQTIDLETVPLNGGFLVKTLVLSIDPFLRGRMKAPNPKAYIVHSPGIGVVIRSELEGVQPGQHVYGLLSHEEFSVQPVLSAMMQIISKVPGLPWSVLLGAAGMPGATAYIGWKEYANPKKGDVAFLAKQDGLKVIASAGSDEKLGADVAFNYKTTDTHEVLAKEGPINIYWDNTALENADQFARFINLGLIVGKTIAVYGFLVASLMPKYFKECTTTIPSMVANGQIKYKEDISYGLEKVGDALLAVQNGANKGKSVVVVAEE